MEEEEMVEEEVVEEEKVEEVVEMVPVSDLDAFKS